MNIKINSVHFDATDKLEDFIQSKVSKLGQYFDNIQGAEVILRVEKPQTIDNKVAEIRIDVPGNGLFAKKHASSFEEAVDLSVEALRSQIQKHKEKVRN